MDASKVATSVKVPPTSAAMRLWCAKPMILNEHAARYAAQRTEVPGLRQVSCRVTSPLAVRRAVIAAPYLRVLRAAAEAAGGEAALAAALAVAPERLRSWLAGEVVPPVAFYVAALEIARAPAPR